MVWAEHIRGHSRAHGRHQLHYRVWKGNHQRGDPFCLHMCSLILVPHNTLAQLELSFFSNLERILMFVASSWSVILTEHAKGHKRQSLRPHQIARVVNYKNKTMRLSGQSPEYSDCHLTHIELTFGSRKNWKTFKFGQFQRSSVKIWVVRIYYDRLASLNSIRIDFVVRDIFPRINNSRYTFKIMDKRAHELVQSMAKLAVYKFVQFCKKWSEVIHLFKFDFRNSVSSMRHKNVLVKFIISIAENWLNKKTTPSINISFS